MTFHRFPFQGQAVIKPKEHRNMDLMLQSGLSKSYQKIDSSVDRKLMLQLTYSRSKVIKFNHAYWFGLVKKRILLARQHDYK